jgi:hypothetical protein
LDGGGALHERPEVGAMHRRGCLDGRAGVRVRFRWGLVRMDKAPEGMRWK